MGGEDLLVAMDMDLAHVDLGALRRALVRAEPRWDVLASNGAAAAVLRLACVASLQRHLAVRFSMSHTHRACQAAS